MKPHTLSRLSCTLLLLPVLLLWFSPSLSRGATSPAAQDVADAARGKALFEKRCTGCHALDQDREGPRLRNVYGTKAGSTPGFKYSSALQSAQITWNDATLNKWLTDTDSLAPDNDMNFQVPKADERADIIRYLRVASGK